MIFERLANSEGELEVKTLEFLESFAEKGLIFFSFFTIYSFLSRTFMYDQFQIVFGCTLFYFTFALVVIIALAPVILLKYSQNEDSV